MKKLMIALAAAAIGAAAQASNVNWGLASGDTLGGISSGTMYLLYSPGSVNWAAFDNKQSFSTEDFAAAGFSTVLDSFQYNSSKVANSKVINGQTKVAPTVGGEATQNLGTGNKQLYIVCLADPDPTAPDPAAITKLAYATPAPVNIQASGMGVSGLVAGTGFSSVEAGNIPEPTSAMLMLLGIAGLALRRKRT